MLTVSLKSLKETNPCSIPTLFQACGQQDTTIDFDWAEQTHEKLKKLGVKSTFYKYPDFDHVVDRRELKVLQEWITDLIPVPSDL